MYIHSVASYYCTVVCTNLAKNCRCNSKMCMTVFIILLMYWTKFMLLRGGPRKGLWGTVVILKPVLLNKYSNSNRILLNTRTSLIMSGDLHEKQCARALHLKVLICWPGTVIRWIASTKIFLIWFPYIHRCTGYCIRNLLIWRMRRLINMHLNSIDALWGK